MTDLVQRYLPPASLAALQAADRYWHNLRHDRLDIPQVIYTEDRTDSTPTDRYDLTICGGTLGILLGATLAKRGWRVLLLEQGTLRGRDQEWNISRHELQTFLELDLLTIAELETTIASEYNPARVAFHGGLELWVRDVLNVGVDPVRLLELLKQKFLQAGGELREHVAFASATVQPDRVTVYVVDRQTNQTQTITTRLLVDAMGHRSPIAAQARQGQRPDSICMVAGSCAQGFAPAQNQTGDLMVSTQPIAHHCQYFWEAFPARAGRTTYLFTYLDSEPDRFSLTFFIEEYLRLLPEYQQIELNQLDFQRFLFGFFPAYRHSPIALPWDRILAIGDSSGGQSPLSFGGFGAMVRHLTRLDRAFDEALRWDVLDARSLQTVQTYQPNIAVTWLFQQTMTIPLDRHPDPQAVNRLLSSVFGAMADAGDRVLKPFLQDVVQFGALSEAMWRSTIADPLTVLKVLPQVGVGSLLDWTRHFLSLGAYGALASVGDRWGESSSQWLTSSPEEQYRFYRAIEAWHYGAGRDYHSPD